MSSVRVCTICARGGSKGVKGKNIRLLGGKPLIAHSVEQARAAGIFEAIAVSSDNDAILDAARSAGATHLIKRPDELATDDAGKLPAIRHAVRELETMLNREVDVVVDLDATSPLRSIGDILGAVEILDQPDAGIVITAAPARRSPYFNLVERQADGSVNLAKAPVIAIRRRQDAPACFDMNASIYVWRRARLMDAETLFQPDTRLFVMPEERSIDIDSELDFEWVEWLLKRKEEEKCISKNSA